MSQTIPTEEIIKNIRRKLLSRGQSVLFGAQLGALIKTEAPETNFKNHGGLRNYCRLYLADFITWNDRDGIDSSDDTYTVCALGKDSDSDPTSSFTQTPGAAPSIEPGWLSVSPNNPSTNIWSAFASATGSRRLALQPQSGNFVVSMPSFDGAVPDGFFEIYSVTEAELRQAVEGFLPQVPTEEKLIFEEAIQSPSNYYVRWLSALRTSSNRKISKKWAHYRLEYLFDLFKSRVVNTGTDAELTEKLVNELRRFQEAANTIRRAALVTPLDQSVAAEQEYTQRPALPHLAAHTEGEDASLLRLMIQDAICSLSEKQLRELNIPAGLMLDAFRKHGKAN